MELKNDKIIKKILIKVPSGKEHSFSLFPFFVTLGEEFPKAEINIICEEGDSLAYNFLPYKARSFERPKDKLSFFQTHHYCANLDDIFNIDLFIDLENSFNSSFIGFNFRATERIGYSTGFNKYLLTKSYSARADLTLEKKAMNLLELYCEKNFSDVKIHKTRDEGTQVDNIEQLFKEPEPPKFVLIMLDNFQNVSKQINLWLKFFDCFENQKFIIWSANDEDLISTLLASVDMGSNSLYMHRGSNSKELFYIYNKVQGVVVNNIWSEGLSTYLGVNCVTFMIENILPSPQYDFFVKKAPRFNFQNSGMIKFKYLDEEKDLELINQVVDHIHFQFKL